MNIKMTIDKIISAVQVEKSRTSNTQAGFLKSQSAENFVVLFNIEAGNSSNIHMLRQCF